MSGGRVIAIDLGASSGRVVGVRFDEGSASIDANTGFTLDISRYAGVPTSSATRLMPSPAVRPPVKPTAATPGCRTRSNPSASVQ